MLSPIRSHPVVVDPRFGGLPGLAHGGYTAGVLATAAGAASAEVRLRRPVPLGRRLGLEHAGEAVELRDGEALLVEARPAELALDVPQPAGPAEAEAASARFPGFHRHLIAGCLVCGTARHDGLGIFPGPVAGRRLVAAPWVPSPALADADGRIPPELVWAALDCPQLWALIAHAPAGTPDVVVTSALAARLERPVMAGEPHVVIGWPIGLEGRRWLAGAAIVGPDGALRAAGRQAAAIAGWGIPLDRARWQAGPTADVARA